MAEHELDEELEELSAAEEFLDYFGINYDQSIVHVNRLHILQRFHDYIHQSMDSMPEEMEPRREIYNVLLTRAYNDFVDSNAQTEKVFKVFQMQDGSNNLVTIEM